MLTRPAARMPRRLLLQARKGRVLSTLPSLKSLASAGWLFLLVAALRGVAGGLFGRFLAVSLFDALDRLYQLFLVNDLHQNSPTLSLGASYLALFGLVAEDASALDPLAEPLDLAAPTGEALLASVKGVALAAYVGFENLHGRARGPRVATGTGDLGLG